MDKQQYIMRVTSKGQMTIPAAVRRVLGLSKNAKVAFRVEGKAVTVEAAQTTLQAAYGAVGPIARPEDYERITEIAHEEQALRVSPDTSPRSNASHPFSSERK